MAHKKNNVHYKTDHGDSKDTAVPLEPVVQMVKDAWIDWDLFWGEKLSKFEAYYERWKGGPVKRDEDWQSDFNKKLTWQAEKTLVPRFHSAIFPTSAPIDVPGTETVDEFQALISKSMVVHWFKIGKFSLEFLRGMKSAAIYGSGFFEDDWFVKVEEVPRRVERTIPDFRPLSGEDGQPIFDENGSVRSVKVGDKKITEVEKRKEVVEDRYRLRKANIFSWRIHPNKLSDEDDFPVIKQEFVTFDELLDLQEKAESLGYSKFENLEAINKDRFEIDEKDIKRLQKDGKFFDKKNPRIELLHYYGPYDDTLDREKSGDKTDSTKKRRKPTWIIVANKKFKLSIQDNPFWHQKPPLFHINWTQDEKPSYYGIGLAEIGASAEDRANNTVNIRVDERRKNIKGGGFYNAGDKKIKKTQLAKNFPGNWKSCTDVNNAVRPDIPVPSSPDDYKEEEVSVAEHREVTGASAALLPAENPKGLHDTATGFKLQIGQAIEKLRPDILTMEIMGVRKIANRALLLTMQFQTQQQAIKLVASKSDLKQQGLEEIYNLSPGDIRQKVDFYATGLQETAEKAEKINNMLKYVEVTSKIPPMQAITRYDNIGKKIALWIGLEDVEELVSMNPFNPYQDVQPQQAQGQPGGQPGQPGQPGGQPQPGGQGLPPQAIQQIAQGLANRGGAGR